MVSCVTFWTVCRVIGSVCLANTFTTRPVPALFDRICDLDEYYLTRCELDLLPAPCGRDSRGRRPPRGVIEYGSGSSLKTRLLLDKLREPAAYVPVDISGEHLQRSAANLRRRYPALPVLP